MKVAAIVPAYNEECRIGAVLGAICAASLIDEIIVVSDGSKDRTAEVAALFPGVRIIVHHRNLGKGAAVATGVRSTDAEVILLIDADLRGLRPRHVDCLVRPILEGVDMSVGIFKKGKLWSDTAQLLTPHISGQRALHRELIEQVPGLSEVRSGIEVAITQIAKKRKMRIRRVILDGVTHTAKERKLGFVKGTAARAKMYAEIGRVIVKARRLR